MGKSDMEAVATIGMFDGVHRGHQDLLSHLIDEARQHCLSSVVFTFDRHPLTRIRPELAPRLLTDVDEKVALIKAAGVDRVVVLDFDEEMRRMTAAEFIGEIARRHGVRRLVMGYDHSFGSDRLKTFEQYSEAAAAHGVTAVRCAPYVDTVAGVTVSSSEVRHALDSGDISLANRLLGRSYRLNGTIVQGRRLGRELGFPTANLMTPAERLIPLSGVYGCRARVKGAGEYRAAVNIGKNPTVSASNPLTIEAHLLGFEGDIYGSEMTLSFVERLRDERRFDDLASLQAQLKLDLQSLSQMK